MKLPKIELGSILLKLINIVPDGILIKAFGLIAQKLIGKLPKEQREAAWTAATDLLVKLVGVAAEGFARGTMEGIKNNNGGANVPL